MATSLTFSVPALPPLVNRAVRHAKGRHYKSPAVDRFTTLVSAEARGRFVTANAYSVGVSVHIPKGKRGRTADLDGYLKYSLDALVHSGVIFDDSRITDIRMHRVTGCEQEATLFTIEGLVG